MSQDASQIRLAANGHIYVAAANTSAPTDPTSSFGAGWTEIGLTDESGVKVNDKRTMGEVQVWQLFYAARRFVKSREMELDFKLVQWNKSTVAFAFGGGTVSTPSAGVYKYVPPAPESTDPRALAVDWLDGSYHYRLIVPQGNAVDGTETELQRGKEALLPVKFKVLQQPSVDPYTLYTDDPAFA